MATKETQYDSSLYFFKSMFHNTMAYTKFDEPPLTLLRLVSNT